MQQQLRREYPAQIAETSTGRKAFGRLIHSSTGCVAIRLSSAGEASEWLRSGSHVTVSAEAASGVDGVSGRVWCVDAGVAWLYTAKPTARQRGRRHVRRACGMPVAIRWLRGDGIAGPWMEGAAVDVSIGGLGVTVAGACDVTEQAEVSFLLPNELDDRDAVADEAADARLATAKRPIVAVVCPAYVKRMPGNLLLLGLEFTRLRDTDRMRLAVFAHAPAAAKKGARAQAA